MCMNSWHRAGTERRGTMRTASAGDPIGVADARRMADLSRLRRVRDRLDREYGLALDVGKLARELHIPTGHLSRKFKAAYGESPYAYLMTRRIERAAALLRNGDPNIADVAGVVGCSSAETFNARFTELVGISPARYREAVKTGRGAA